MVNTLPHDLLGHTVSRRLFKMAATLCRLRARHDAGALAGAERRRRADITLRASVTRDRGDYYFPG